MKRSEEAAFRNIERYYIAAHTGKRLMKANPKQGLQRGLENENLHDIRVWNVENMAEKYWRKEVGAVWHTIREDGSGLIPDSDSEDDR
ncbi:hypothetical protein HBI17_129550 [Parastagonospora nodorum]|nr:hypothetical protein HBI17_129550 [Parastagonospora nodorum]